MEHDFERNFAINSEENEKKELSPEVQDLLERFKFSLPEPNHSYGYETKANGLISERIKDREYDMILAEDTSGRAAGLLLYEAMKEYYKNSDQQLKLNFVAGSKDAKDISQKQEKLSEYITEITEAVHSPEKRLLVVTEVIMDGKSLKPLVDALKDLGVNFDVLSLGYGRTLEPHRFKVKNLNKEWGDVSDGLLGIPKIFQKRYISGVVKNPDDVLSKRADDVDREKLQIARQELQQAAENLAKIFVRYEQDEIRKVKSEKENETWFVEERNKLINLQSTPPDNIEFPTDLLYWDESNLIEAVSFVALSKIKLKYGRIAEFIDPQTEEKIEVNDFIDTIEKSIIYSKKISQEIKNKEALLSPEHDE